MSCFVHRMKRKEQRRLNQLKEQKEHQPVYECTACHLPLFEEAKKFDSKTGFPSFWLHIDENVRQNFLTTYGRERIQLLCNHCGQHLGHLFPNKKTPTGIRYCINSNAIHLNES